MPDTGIDTASPGTALSDRGFWGIFVAAWAAYVGLYLTAAIGEEGLGVTRGIGIALANTVPPAGLAVVVALRRRDLLRPERSLTTTVLVHVGVGLLYALTTALAIMALLALMGWDAPTSEGGSSLGRFLLRMLSGLFLYTILAGFLMWSESIRRVHESRALASREAMLRAQAEAKAIRAQFNPHFVFNTLHSLMLLVRSDPAAAEQAIEDVAELIRYASFLQKRDVDLVPLEKELAVVRRYLALEKLRLEDRLQAEWKLAVEPGSVMIPAFALQTLVENAVRHGLETRSGGGTIRIEIGTDAGRMSLTVADDGDGADPDAVAAAAGHGLDLLTRRLEALYGADGAISWVTAPGRGFTVTVRIPAVAPVATPDPGPDAAHDAVLRGGATT